MKKFVLGPALAALAMFLFGAIYWMSPFPYKTHNTTANDSAAGLALAQLFPETGTYLIPGVNLDKTQLAALYKRGPSAEVQFIKEGHEMMEPTVFLKGYMHYFVVSLLLAMLLAKAAPSFKGYCSRVSFRARWGSWAPRSSITATRSGGITRGPGISPARSTPCWSSRSRAWCSPLM
jgi:cbb3-type cytochrome oxidase subunit 3